VANTSSYSFDSVCLGLCYAENWIGGMKVCIW